MKKYKLLIFGLIALFFGSNSWADSIDATETNDYYGSCYTGTSTYQGSMTYSACESFTLDYSGYSSIAHYSEMTYSGWAYTMRFYSSGWKVIGQWKTNYTSSESTYSCDDVDYPNLNEDGITCSADFVIDNDVVNEYAANAAAALAAADDFSFCVTSDDGYSVDCVVTDDVVGLASSVDDELEEQELGIASQSEDLESIEDDADDLDSVLEDNPDSLTAAAASVVVDALAEDTEDLLDESTALNEASETLQDTVTSTALDLSSSLDDVETEYQTYADLVTQLKASTSQDEYDATLVEMQNAGYCDGSYCGDFSKITASLDDANDDADTITAAASTVSTNTTTINNNTTTTNSNSTTSNTVTNNITNNYSSTTTGDDSSDDEDDEDDEEFTLENSETDYESFSDVMTGFYDSVDESAIATAFSSFSDVINVPTGSCPTFSMDLSDTPIGSTLSTTLHCDVWDSSSDIISGCMMVVWLFGGFRIVAGA